MKWVSGNYFTTLGVVTAAGRPLLISDDPQPPGLAVAVISDAFWARRFGRDPAVVGRSVRLRGAAFAIVGVARRGFASETPGESVDLWMPICRTAEYPRMGMDGAQHDVAERARTSAAGCEPRTGARGSRAVYERIRDEMAADTDSAEFRRSVLESRLEVSAARGGISRLRDNLVGAADDSDGHRRTRASGRVRERRHSHADQGDRTPTRDGHVLSHWAHRGCDSSGRA